MVLVVFVIGFAWVVTWLTAADYNNLILRQVSGAAPTEIGLYLLLSGVMMFAMMMPAALPMVETYRGLATVETGKGEAAVSTSFFVFSYLLVWSLFVALSLVILTVLGIMGGLGGPMVYLPGAVLVAGGLYQFTSWKRFCLNLCRSPMNFVMTHWRKGTRGALKMGFYHGTYCLGCCWLLMLVLFVAGAMSVLWMGVISGLILAEKVWSPGESFSRLVGVASAVVGLTSIALTYFS